MTTTFPKLIALVLMMSLLFSNCATIVSKSSYPVSIDCNPKGSQVSITDKKGKEIFKGTTPTAVRLKPGAGFFSRAEYQVRLSYRGYDEKVIPVTFKLNGWYFGNIVFGGLIGMLIVDPASGAMWRIEKQNQDIFETLTQSMSSVTEPSLKIMDINDIPETMKRSLVRIK
jgi:hypothetical protein